MRLFLVAFFIVYGGMHLYVFLKARGAFGFGPAGGFALALFMLSMVAAPLIIRLLERQGLDPHARAVSFVGYGWLGLLFIFISTSLCIDVYRAAVSGVGLVLGKDASAFLPSAKLAFYAPLAVAVLGYAYGYTEAWDIKTERVLIRTNRLPPGMESLRIVQISDVHVGLIVRHERLGNILGKVKALEPDMLVSTGDLVDGQINNLRGLGEMFQEVNPRFGKYAVTGNHEYYAGLGQALEFTTKAGFRVLRGEAVSGVINMAGVDDETGSQLGIEQRRTEREVLAGLPRDKFTVLLRHRPAVAQESRGLFDLQLSGHTHKGQIFPFRYVGRLFYPGTGRTDLPGGSVLYSSRGTGTWGPPIRVLAPPEITLIELAREPARG